MSLPQLTVLQLLAWILGSILLQIALGGTLALWRRSRSVGGNVLAVSQQSQTASTSAWMGLREFRVSARNFEDADETQCSFFLQPVDGEPLPPYKPGQYLTFSLDVAPQIAGSQAPDTLAATRAVMRCYSLSDSPDPTQYRVTIKRVPAPANHPEFAPGLSSNFFHDRVQVGSILRVKAPGGQFFIDTDPTVPVVLIGGGVGITPMMAMLRWCSREQPERSVHLYYGVRHGGEQAFTETLEAIAAAHPPFRVNVMYSQPRESDQYGVDYHHQGHIAIELLRRTLPHGRHQFYVCGPPAMMEALVPALVEWGVPISDIHYETFGPASIRLPGTPTTSAAVVAKVEIGFLRSGRTLVWDGQDVSLLDFAERHGVNVESGCRSGSCGSCETRVLEGTVEYESSPDHAIAPGHCLLCVGRPSTTLKLAA